MARKMGMRGRPGLFFVIILVIFLAIFFLTWKSMSPKRKVDVKDIYSMNFQSVKQNTKTQHQPHSDLNDVWHRAKLMNSEKLDEQENERDVDYHFKNSVKLNPVVSDMNKAHVKSPLSSLLHASQQPVVKQLDDKPYYHKPDESMKIIGGRMERFVHLDLKGAAPKLSYFEKLFPLFSRLGATGLLIEYEDMFPYSGKLQVISAENSYTREQITELLRLAKLNSLQVIPLIQTFGHMEFVLKSLDLKSLRESEYTPQVIDITANASYNLIREMVEQILVTHPAITYLHIGCDEVYEIGRGKSADIIVKERVTTEKLFLRHVKRVAGIVAEVGKNKVRPIIWDDELRKMPDEEIVLAGLPSAVDIMVWRYTPDISDRLTEDVWQKYARLFKTVWAASSFKGATGSRQVYTEPQYHIINHFSWMDAIAKYGQIVNFKGIALTGWQRFDHFATLCELLPVAIPSLAVCLASIKNGGFDKGVHKTTSRLLDCTNLIEMNFPKLDTKERSAIISQDCRFPGNMVYYGVQQLWGYKQFQETDRRSGWLSDYQINRGFTNPGQLKVLSMRLFDLNSKLIQIKEPLEEQLNDIYSRDTVEEWLEENVFEMQRELKGLQQKIKIAANNTHWARRPNIPLVATLTSGAKVKAGMITGSVVFGGTKTGGQPEQDHNQLLHGKGSLVKVPQQVTLNSNSIFNQRQDVNANDLLKNSPKRLETFHQIQLNNNNLNSNGVSNPQENKKMASNVERHAHNPFLNVLYKKENSLKRNDHAQEIPKPHDKVLQRQSNDIDGGNDPLDHLNQMGHKQNPNNEESNMNAQIGLDGSKARDPMALKVEQNKDRLDQGTQDQFGGEKGIQASPQESFFGKLKGKVLGENRNVIQERNGNDVINEETMSEKDSDDIFNHNRNGVKGRNENNFFERTRKGNAFKQNDNILGKRNNEMNMSGKSADHIFDNHVNHNSERRMENNEQKKILDFQDNKDQGKNYNFLKNHVKIDKQRADTYEVQDDKDDVLSTK